MVNYKDLETELVALLNTYFTTNNLTGFFEAVAIPENDKQAQDIQGFTKGRVVIEYNTSDYNDTISLGQSVQDEIVYIRTIFSVSNLRQSNGMYDLIYHTKRCLLGYRPQQCTQRLVIQKQEVPDYNNNNQRTALVWKTQTANVNEYAGETQIAPALTQVNTNQHDFF